MLKILYKKFYSTLRLKSIKILHSIGVQYRLPGNTYRLMRPDQLSPGLRGSVVGTGVSQRSLPGPTDNKQYQVSPPTSSIRFLRFTRYEVLPV